MTTRLPRNKLAFSLPIALLGCGTSIYSSITPKDSHEALLEKAVLALDARNFAEARGALSTIWEKDKSNKVTQLFANAILGDAGFDLYSIIVDLLNGADASQFDSLNDVLGALGNAITVNAKDNQLDDLQLTLQVLNQAENQESSSLDFQKCLTVGIYALPVIDGINESIATIQSTLDGLPARLSVASGGSRSCLASTSTIAAVGSDLTNTIAEIGLISERVASINTVLADCSLLSTDDASSSINAITSNVTSVIENADRGCTVPDTGNLGGRILPDCMTSYVLETAADAQAGDGNVNGCEVFLNCASGSCFN